MEADKTLDSRFRGNDKECYVDAPLDKTARRHEKMSFPCKRESRDFIKTYYVYILPSKRGGTLCTAGLPPLQKNVGGVSRPRTPPIRERLQRKNLCKIRSWSQFCSSFPLRLF